MTNVTHIFKSITIVTASIFSLVSCDPNYNVDVYLKNATEQTIVFHSIRGEHRDSMRHVYFFSAFVDSTVLKSGEKILLFNHNDLGDFEKEYLTDLMLHAFGDGMIIEFEKGEPYVYHPDSSDVEFHSPYNENSFFHHKHDNDHEFTYDVLY